MKTLILLVSFIGILSFSDAIPKNFKDMKFLQPKNFIDLQQFKRDPSGIMEDGKVDSMALVDPSLSRLMKRNYNVDLLVDPSINRLIKRYDYYSMVDPSINRLIKRLNEDGLLSGQKNEKSELVESLLKEICQDKIIPLVHCLKYGLFEKM